MAERARVYPLRRVPTAQPRSQQPLPPRQALPSRQPSPPEQPSPPQQPSPPEPLWREVLGQRLRALRLDQQETISETAGRAGISPHYLSEIERGRKEPSSEMIAALAGDLRRQQASASSRASGPVMLALAA